MNLVRGLALIVVLGTLSLPMFADDVQFSNNGGTFTSNAVRTTLSLSGSTGSF